MLNTKTFFCDLCRVRESAPVVHCITNYVAMNINANALLAIGASPLMSACPEEMEDISAISASLCVNIGCIDMQQIEAMKRAVSAARNCRKPYVLDPVGVGASKLRKESCLLLTQLYCPTVIRGNASEILCLADACANAHGIDAANATAEALLPAQHLAKRCGCVVVVSGPSDLITDGERVESVNHGSPLMRSVTAMGCTASALTSAFLAVQPDPFVAAQEAMLLMGLAGEQAAVGNPAPGSFAMRFIDALYNISTSNGG